MRAWTYSSLDKYTTCPKQYYHLKVAKDYVDPPNEHTRWGEEVHSALEDYLSQGRGLPESMYQWKPFIDKLLSLPGDKYAEVKFAVDKNFNSCAWDQAWSRGIVDVLVIHNATAVVLDYKTGKRKPTEQLWLYALYVFAHHPEVKAVHTVFAWLKERKVDKDFFTRDDISKLWMHFLPIVSRLEKSYEKDVWPPKTSGLCRRWCPVLSCEHNGRQ